MTRLRSVLAWTWTVALGVRDEVRMARRNGVLR